MNLARIGSVLFSDRIGWMDCAFAAIRSTDLDFLFSFADVAGDGGDVGHLPHGGDVGHLPRATASLQIGR